MPGPGTSPLHLTSSHSILRLCAKLAEGDFLNDTFSGLYRSGEGRAEGSLELVIAMIVGVMRYNCGGL